MSNLIECFHKIHHHIILDTFLQVECNVMNKFYQLCFTATFFSETMLERIENVVHIEMLHEFATDNVLKKFTIDTCLRYRAIIGWACLVSFLIDGCNTGLLPDVWETLMVEGGFEK